MKDLINSVAQYISAANAQTVQFISNHSEIVVFETGCLATAIALIFVMRRMERPQKPRDEEMRRRIQLDSMYADRFGDALFDMLMENVITRHEYKKACVRFGIAYRLSDLLVRKNSKRGLKYRVEHNCAVMHKQIFKLKPRIPGPKPGEDVPTVQPVAKRKVWLVIGKAKPRLKSAS